MAGRPTKFEPGKAEEILVAVRRGMTFQAAAALAGVTYQTVHNWEKRGKAEVVRVLESARNRPLKSEASFAKFFYDLQQARAQGEFKLADNILRAADGGGKIRETKTVQVMQHGEVIRETTTTIEKEFAPDWRASAFILERRFNWTQQSQNLNIDLDDLSDDELERVMAGETPLTVLSDRVKGLKELTEGEE